MLDPHQEKVLILDFGSQYTQLIARRVRELKVYCEIHPYIMPLADIKQFNPQGIILSGGPRSVYDRDAPSVDPDLFTLGVPVLGICYGIQLLNHLLGGEVAPAVSREYGHKPFTITRFDDLFYGLTAEEQVWMSHGDRVERLAREGGSLWILCRGISGRGGPWSMVFPNTSNIRPRISFPTGTVSGSPWVSATILRARPWVGVRAIPLTWYWSS